MIGNLKVQIIQAKILQDNNIIGTIKPYVVFIYQNKQTKSKVSEGLQAKWKKQVHNFQITSQSNVILLQIRDEQFFKDKVVGKAQQLITHFILQPNKQILTNILFISQGNQIGIIQVKFTYYQLIGILKIKVMSAILKQNLEFFGKMDPYCKIKYDQIKKKTKVHNNGGKNPVWNQQFQFKIVNPNIPFEFQLYDEDITSDDFIGNYNLDINQYIKKQVPNMQINLMKKKNEAGNLQIGLTWI